MSSSYRLELDKWLSSLEVKSDFVMDIGGAQLSIKGRTKSWDVGQYIIADLPNPHADSPKAELEFDLNKGARGLTAYLGVVDLIFCLEVFDYIYRPEAALEGIKKLLGRSGQAWVTFPAFYPHHQPIEDDALRYMEGGIKKLAAHVGLVIEEMIPRRPETDALEKAWRAERMRAAKHYDHNITGWIVRFSKGSVS